ncbi:MAG TPA: ribose ABC transporter permease [Lacunisphaera sp.]|jgi:ribose transport system permease protein|nr:ribose ABC transporter permease [Lacunisphaera sp.]HQY05595.1 ribose ABC transporter permease [Lacunisphaera sp.]
MKLPPVIARHARQFGTFAVFVVLCAIISVLTPHFFTVTNLLNVAQQTVINALIAVGLTYVIISGGIDLSVGSILAFSGVVMAHTLRLGWPLPLAILAGVGVGAGCGLVNGLLIAYGRLPPFIATLGMMSVARGGALLATDGRPVSGFDESFRWLATGEIAGVPVPVIIMVLVYAVAHLVLQRTKFGRYTYAIGGNEEASLLSGVPVRLYKTGIYIVGGGLAALGAVLLTARLNSAQPIAGINYELDAIAATVIGGTSLMGGQGSVIGTLIGALIMGVLRNGLNLLGVSSFIQQVVIGIVIIAAVLLDTFFKQSKR